MGNSLSRCAKLRRTLKGVAAQLGCMMVAFVTGCPPTMNGNENGNDNTAGPEPVFPANYRETYEVVRDCRCTVEHNQLGASLIRVLASPDAVEAYLNDDVIPEGGVIVKEEFTSGDCSDDSLLLWRVMRKEAEGFLPAAGDYSWQTVELDRTVVDTSPATCATSGCHGAEECVVRDWMCTAP